MEMEFCFAEVNCSGCFVREENLGLLAVVFNWAVVPDVGLQSLLRSMAFYLTSLVADIRREADILRSDWNKGRPATAKTHGVDRLPSFIPHLRKNYAPHL